MPNNYYMFLALALCITMYASYVSANDSEVAITPEGLQFKIERDVSIEEEDLFISLNKVAVSYVFENHSNTDITEEIAFPMPNYSPVAYEYSGLTYPIIGGFRVYVNSKLIECKHDIHAFVDIDDKEMDITDTLTKMSIPIDNVMYNLKLSKENKEILIKLNAIDTDNNPLWTINEKYHWTQTFPANSRTKITHSYSPHKGGGHIQFDRWDPSHTNGEIDDPENCIDPETKKTLEATAKKKLLMSSYPSINLNYDYVSYILTTANNWKKPIRKFHLIVEGNEGSIVTLCFDHKLMSTTPNRFEANIDNFIPIKELTVYYYYFIEK